MRPSAPRLEVEAKFLVRSPAVHGAAARLKSVGPFRLIGAGRERQRNTYFDTDGLRLKRDRCVLKMREVGPRAELTFKRELLYRRGVSKRVEITVPLTPAARRRLLEKGVVDLKVFPRVKAVAGSRRLHPLFVLETDRRRRLLALGSHRVAMDVDRVTVRVGRRRAVHREVEVENVGAPEKVYGEAIRALRARFGKGWRRSRIPKADYGYRLFRRS